MLSLKSGHNRKRPRSSNRNSQKKSVRFRENRLSDHISMTQEELAPDISWAESSSSGMSTQPFSASANIYVEGLKNASELKTSSAPRIKLLQKAFALSLPLPTPDDPDDESPNSLLNTTDLMVSTDGDMDKGVDVDGGGCGLCSPSPTEPWTKRPLGRISTNKDDLQFQPLHKSIMSASKGIVSDPGAGAVGKATSTAAAVTGDASGKHGGGRVPLSEISLNTLRGRSAENDHEDCTGRAPATIRMASPAVDKAEKQVCSSECSRSESVVPGDETPPLPAIPFRDQSQMQPLRHPTFPPLVLDEASTITTAFTTVAAPDKNCGNYRGDPGSVSVSESRASRTTPSQTKVLMSSSNRVDDTQLAHAQPDSAACVPARECEQIGIIPSPTKGAGTGEPGPGNAFGTSTSPLRATAGHAAGQSALLPIANDASPELSPDFFLELDKLERVERERREACKTRTTQGEDGRSICAKTVQPPLPPLGHDIDTPKFGLKPLDSKTNSMQQQRNHPDQQRQHQQLQQHVIQQEQQQSHHEQLFHQQQLPQMRSNAQEQRSLHQKSQQVDHHRQINRTTASTCPPPPLPMAHTDPPQQLSNMQVPSVKPPCHEQSNCAEAPDAVAVDTETWSEQEMQAIEEMERLALLALQKRRAAAAAASAAPSAQSVGCNPSELPSRPMTTTGTMPGNDMTKAIAPPVQSSSNSVSSASATPMHREASHTRSDSSPSPVRCLRLVALDVCENVHTRTKEVRCFGPRQAQEAERMGGDGNTEGGSLGRVMTVRLSGEWFSTDVSAGDIFHLVYIGNSDLTSGGRNDSCERESVTDSMTDDFGLVVVHPDLLVSPTRIVESLACARKGVISERVRCLSGTGSAAVMGNVKHAFVEDLIDLVLPRMQSHCSGSLPDALFPSEKEFSKLVSDAVKSNLEELWALRARDSDLSQALRALVRPVVQWLWSSRSVSATLGQEVRSASEGALGGRWQAVSGVEQTVWSPALGVKGQLDLVVDGVGGGLVFPVELKTGKRHPNALITHRAQVMLYVLMMLVRERSSPLSAERAWRSGSLDSEHHSTPSGLLMYVSEEGIHCDVIAPSWMELRALVSARNRLAVLLKTASDVTVRPLPPVIRSRAECEGCFRASECMAYHAAIEDGMGASSGVNALFKYALRGLTGSHLSYLRHWDGLLDLEALAESDGRPPSQWHLDGFSLEAGGGLCVAGLTLVGVEGDGGDAMVMLRRVGRGSNTGSTVVGPQETGPRADTCSLAVGDRVSVSVERSRSVVHSSMQGGMVDIEDMRTDSGSDSALTSIEPHLCSGSVYSVSADEICVKINRFPRRLASLLRKDNGPKDPGRLGNTSLRLDKDESFDNIATLRMNLMALLVQSHDPKSYAEWARVQAQSKTQTQTQSSTTQTQMPPPDRLLNAKASQQGPSQHPVVFVDKQASPAKRRIRDLIIDLIPPEFVQVESADMYLLAPAGLTQTAFQDSLAHIDRYLQLKGKSSSEGTGTVMGSISSQRNPVQHVNGNGNSNSSVPVVRGHYGELSVIGGFQVFPGCQPTTLWQEFNAMNSGQRAAVIRLLTARDYVLILGMPGTGKTSTLSLAVRCLLARGLRVLVTAYTHAAVDNLLLKLKEAGVSPEIALRVGSTAAVHSGLHEYVVSDKVDSLAAYAHRLAGVRLVVCTALAAARSVIVASTPFDWCVMDEAGQISQPAALGPVMTARRFVLVGDDYQLPPLVLSSEAQARGMDVSLFKRLAEAHPQAVVSLTQQYRMNEDVQVLCNTLIYDHRLRCASGAVANRRLHLPGLHTLPRPSAQAVARGDLRQANGSLSSERDDWLFRCIHPSSSVVFIDTDSLAGGGAPTIDESNRPFVLREWKADETNLARGSAVVAAVSKCDDSTTGNRSRISGKVASQGSMSNTVEAELVCLLARALLLSGLAPSQLGLLSPYRGQVSAIRSLLRIGSEEGGGSTRDGGWGEVLLSTVDQFQGKDVEALIVSTVRSHSDSSAGDLLRDWRRVNVAITRARCKLIIIGSVSKLSTIPVTADLCRLVHARGWVLQLPPSALAMYGQFACRTGAREGVEPSRSVLQVAPVPRPLVGSSQLSAAASLRSVR